MVCFKCTKCGAKQFSACENENVKTFTCNICGSVCKNPYYKSNDKSDEDKTENAAS